MIHTLGYYGFNNSGDEAFKLAFPKLFPTVDFSFVSEIPEYTENIILGGGAVLGEQYFHSRFANVSKIVGLGVELISYNQENIKLFERDKSKFSSLYVRNREDVSILRSIGYINVTFIPDLVLGLDAPPKRKTQQLLNRLNVFGRKKITRPLAIIITSAALYNRALENKTVKCSSGLMGSYNLYVMNLGWVARELSITFNCDVLFLPLAVTNSSIDYLPAIQIQSLESHESSFEFSVIQQYLDVNEILMLIQNASIVISHKYHGAIYSAICGVPCINISLEKKCLNLAQELGIPTRSLVYDPYDDVQKKFIVRDIDTALNGSNLAGQLAVDSLRCELYNALNVVGDTINLLT